MTNKYIQTSQTNIKFNNEINRGVFAQFCSEIGLLKMEPNTWEKIDDFLHSDEIDIEGLDEYYMENLQKENQDIENPIKQMKEAIEQDNYIEVDRIYELLKEASRSNGWSV